MRTELGVGPDGTVFEAYDRSREEAVAVKVLRSVDQSSVVALAAQLREWMTLEHPGLVAPYELVVIDQQWLLISELLPGPDFSAAVKATGRLRAEPAPRPSEWQTIRDWVAQALHAIAYLSRLGRVHGSLAPSNLLLDQNGRLRLTDSGLNQLFPGGSAVAQVVSFQAPELLAANAERAAPTEKSDLYSLGVLLFEGLTGIRPGAGRDRSPKTRREVIPDDLDKLCLGLLQPEPSDRPDAETALAILEGRPPQPSPDVVEGSPFIGREAELQILKDAATSLPRTGPGRSDETVVWIRGRSGIGKTRLIERFLELQRREREDTLVLRSPSYRQVDRPFKAVRGMVDALATLPLADLVPDSAEREPLAAIFPSLGGPAADREEAFRALRGMLVALASRSPVIVLFEDLHWGDADSALVFAELVHDPMPPYLVVASYRSENYERSPFLGALPAETLARGTELSLEGLSDDEARLLVGALLRSSASEDDSERESRVAQIVAASGGNPLLLETLARYHTDYDDELAGVTSISEGRLSLSTVFRSQIEALSQTARALLQILALAGMPLSARLALRATRLVKDGESESLPADVASSGGLPSKPTPPNGSETGSSETGNSETGNSENGLLRSLEACGLIEIEGREGSGRRVALRHDQIARAALSNLNSERRRELHGALASAMEDEEVPVDSGVMADHLRRYRDDERAAAYALAAADQAMEQLAFGRAAGLYRMAVELSHGHSGSELHVRFAEALRLSGRAVEAAGEYLNAIRAGGVQRVGELQLRAAEQLLISGHIDPGLNILRHVFRGLNIKFPERAGSDFFSLLWLPRGEPGAFRRRAEVEIPAEELLRVDAYWAGAVGLISTDPGRAKLMQRRHLRAALRSGDAKRVARALAMEVFSASAGGTRTLPKTQRLLERSTELAEEVGDPESLGRAALAAVMTETGIGHWDRAVKLARQAALVLEERCSGVAWELRTNQDLLLQALNGLGAFGQILERVPELLKDAEQHDDLYAQNQLGIWMARARLIQDLPQHARDRLIDVRSREQGDLFRWPRLNAELIECEIGLYEGDASILDRLAELREEIRASNILSNQLVRVRLGILRARAALVQAKGQSGIGRQACLRLAENCLLSVEREGTDWGSSLARVVEASIDVDRQQIEAAVAKYRAVEEIAAASRTVVLERVCRYRRGSLIGGDEGAELKQDAESGLRSEGVVAPERLCDLFAPDLRPDH